MNRTMLFAAGLIAGAVCLIIALVYWTGVSGLGQHLKHGLLFFGLAVVAFLFAAVNRPVGPRVQQSTRSDIHGAGDLHRQ